MRALFLAAAMTLTAPLAFAQPAPERPVSPAPAATAPIEARQAWCTDYAAWFVSHTPDPSPAAGTRATQRFETERNSCVLDPQTYERQTIAELAHTTQTT